MLLKQSAKGLKWSDMNFRAPDKYLEENGDKCLYDDTTWFVLTNSLVLWEFAISLLIKNISSLFKLSCLFYNHIYIFFVAERLTLYHLFLPQLETVHNYPAAHHHKASPLSQDWMNKLRKSLYVVFVFPVMEKPNWREGATKSRHFTVNLDVYCKYLQVQFEWQQSRHLSLGVMRFPFISHFFYC